jgi:hypothetical protein
MRLNNIDAALARRLFESAARDQEVGLSTARIRHASTSHAADRRSCSGRRPGLSTPLLGNCASR